MPEGYVAQNSAGLSVGFQEKGSQRERPVYEQEGGKRLGFRAWKGKGEGMPAASCPGARGSRGSQDKE